MSVDWEIKTDRTQLSRAVMDRVREQGPIRLSDRLLKLWCGANEPTGELVEFLADRGFSIEPGLDHHAGWQVSLVGDVPADSTGNLLLFGGAK